MELWMPVTILAALAQTARFGLQKQLKATRLSTAGATFARFVYSAPLVALIVTLNTQITGQQVPAMPGVFWVYALLGGLAQILATMCVVALFAHRNFSVGITFKKTEALMAIPVGILVLGEWVSGWGVLAIMIGLAGVLLLSDPPEASADPWHKRLMNRATGLGLLSGVLFACSGVGYRGASLSLYGGDGFMRATVTLAIVTMAQALAMALWLRLRETGEITRVLAAWRVAALVGITSMIGSTCWFLAFTLEKVAYVKALGQVELLFSLVVSVFIFKERITRRELQGGALLIASILALILVV